MPETWYKVDNVAKVFLASINRRDPRVFRVSCTLNEDVDPDRLNQALEQTARENPQFQVTLHRGLFWHYFESTNLKPQAVPETLAPCAMLYGPQIKNELLYRVSYYGARINVEMFHAISDGNGGMVFLKTLVHNYLQLKNPELANVPGEERAEMDFQKALLNGKLPYTVGGGIGQSRICMFYLRKAHIGEVQSSIWPDDVLEEAASRGVYLL